MIPPLWQNSGQGQAREGAKWKGEAWCYRNPPGHGQLSVCPLQAIGTEQDGPSGEPAGIRFASNSPREVLLWGLIPGESGDLLRACCRQWGCKTQAGCCVASHGLCWAHTHTCGHTPHTHTDTKTSGTCIPGPASTSQNTKGNWGPEWWSGTSCGHLPAQGPSLPLWTNFSPTPLHQLVKQKTKSTTQLRSRASPGAVWAVRGRALLAHDHSMTELVPILQQGLDLGRYHSQPLLQQLPPSCDLLVPVPKVDGQGTMPGSHSTGRHHISSVLTLFKMKHA